MFYVYLDGEQLNRDWSSDWSITSPMLTVEIGKAGSFEFAIPPSHPKWAEIKKLKSKVEVYEDDILLLKGRVLSFERDFQNNKKVFVEGDLAYLVDSVQEPLRYRGTTEQFFRQVVYQHNVQVDDDKQFEVGEIAVKDREILVAGKSGDDLEIYNTALFNPKQILLDSTSSEWQTTLDYLDEGLVKTCGGYLRTRYADGKTYLDWVADSTTESLQNVRFGKNMLDLKDEETAEDIFTVLIPLGDDGLTVANIATDMSPAGSIRVYDEERIKEYGYITQTKVFDSVTKAETLYQNAVMYMASKRTIEKTYEISAVDMHALNPEIAPIRVGDMVNVISEPHLLARRMMCRRIDRNLEKPENSKYSFGNEKQTLTERYREDKKKSGGGGGGGGTLNPDDEDKEEKKSVLGKIFDTRMEHGVDGTKAFRRLVSELKEGERIIGQAIVGTEVDDTSSMATLSAQWNEKVASGEVKTLSDITATATKNAADLSLVSGITGENTKALGQLNLGYDKLSGAYAKLSAELNDTKDILDEQGNKVGELEVTSKSALDMIANIDEATATLKTEYNEKVAEIELTASELESKINLKADTTTVKKLIADSITADAIMSLISTTSVMNAQWLKCTWIDCSGSVNANEIRVGTSTVATLVDVNDKIDAHLDAKPHVSVSWGTKSNYAVGLKVGSVTNTLCLTTHKHKVTVGSTTYTTGTGIYS